MEIDVTSEPPNDALNNILQLAKLNDDCLYTIFGNLTTNQLNAIALTCIRFQSIARAVYKIKHTNKCFKITVTGINRIIHLFLQFRPFNQ
jgi:hypothetical protein